MALTVRIQAACLLLLLLASLTSASALHQTTQLANLQTQDTAGATAGLMVRTPGPPFRASQPSLRPHPLTLPSFLQPGLQRGLQRRRRRDTHFPICIFCCGCCYPSKCGICCKT
ncbi:PREDICTED: hepcidin [Myotis davidii]|uniref:hepcidin n=1 Tax=Myotis davidii TaxID=225400 RepID=UPI000766E1B7|nr:PREDICTED: hepcidin [Myotis davidii]